MKRLLFVAALAACGGSTTEPAPVAAAPSAAPSPASASTGVINVTRAGFAGLSAETRPTQADVKKALGNGFKVETDPVTKRVSASRADGVAFDVKPSASGTKIDTVRTTSDAVRFPWDARVGMSLGTHRHWAKMTCEAADAPGVAVCFADPKRAFRLEVEHDGPFPAKEDFADKVVKALVWKPSGGPG